MIDMCTRFAVADPVVNHDAHTTGIILSTEICSRYGAPSVILSHQGSHFVSRSLDEF